MKELKEILANTHFSLANPYNNTKARGARRFWLPQYSLANPLSSSIDIFNHYTQALKRSRDSGLFILKPGKPLSHIHITNNGIC